MRGERRHIKRMAYRESLGVPVKIYQEWVHDVMLKYGCPFDEAERIVTKTCEERKSKMGSEKKPFDIQEAIDIISLATCEGDWHSVGNTVYLCDKEHDGKGKWVAFLGDTERV